MTIKTSNDLCAEAAAERVAVQRAQSIRIRSRSKSKAADTMRRLDNDTTVCAVMADGTEVELESVVAVRWEHRLNCAPVVILELLDVEIDAEAERADETGDHPPLAMAPGKPVFLV